MYTVDIRPLLEYAAFVWDGCSQSEVENLEKVQSFAARIVTGLALKNLCISRQAGNNFQMGRKQTHYYAQNTGFVRNYSQH